MRDEYKHKHALNCIETRYKLIPVPSCLSGAKRIYSGIGIGIVIIGMMLALVGCGTDRSVGIRRVALLAPFEGRYREVGYNAYYAAQMALADFGAATTELLAIDDGGTVENAADRALALAQDSLVKAVVALGYAAADGQTQRALAGIPMLIVGGWESQPETETSFMLASREVLDMRTTSPSMREVTSAARLTFPVVGGEVFALVQFPLLSVEEQRMTIVSNARLADESFRERYAQSGLFVPAPGLLATLSYDAVAMALQAAQEANPADALATITYNGLNGTIRFEDGYWADTPVLYYGYNSEGNLIPVEGIVE